MFELDFPVHPSLLRLERSKSHAIGVLGCAAAFAAAALGTRAIFPAQSAAGSALAHGYAEAKAALSPATGLARFIPKPDVLAAYMVVVFAALAVAAALSAVARIVAIVRQLNTHVEGCEDCDALNDLGVALGAHEPQLRRSAMAASEEGSEEQVEDAEDEEEDEEEEDDEQHADVDATPAASPSGSPKEESTRPASPLRRSTRAAR